MTTKDIRVKRLHSVDLLEILQHLQREEIKELGIVDTNNTIMNSQRLPDNSYSISRRLFDEIKEDCYGNQQFHNDSFYRYSFDNMDEDVSGDVKKLIRLCSDIGAVNVEPGNEFSFILFEVCW